MTNLKDRNTWQRQAQERTRAAMDRRLLWGPGGTYNDKDRRLSTYEPHLRVI